MELILADRNRKEIRFARELEADIEIGTENDFEMTAAASEWKGDIDYGCLLYLPGTEFGGIVGEIESRTKTGEIFLRGDTWRGILAKKVIEPPKGQDYRLVSGELNAVIRAQTAECGLGDLFAVPDINSGVTVENFQFDRYCTLLFGVEKMLENVAFRLDITYIKNDTDAYVRLQAVPATDYSESREFSQDCKLDFTVSEKKRGINHLVCLGKGELKDRTVRHLYVQKDGSIGTEQHFFGFDERAEIFEDNNSEAETLIENGTKRLKERMDSKTMKVDITDEIEQELQIGDIVGGRDYITGLTVRKPVTGKILNIRDGETKTEYKIEGGD